MYSRNCPWSIGLIVPTGFPASIAIDARGAVVLCSWPESGQVKISSQAKTDCTTQGTRRPKGRRAVIMTGLRVDVGG